MRAIKSAMIESDRFGDKKGSWFHLQRKSSGDWGNLLCSTRRRPPILNMYGLSREAVTGS